MAYSGSEKTKMSLWGTMAIPQSFTARTPSVSRGTPSVTVNVLVAPNVRGDSYMTQTLSATGYMRQTLSLDVETAHGGPG